MLIHDIRADAALAARVRAHPDFQDLVTRRATTAWPLFGAMLAIYFGFVALVAFQPALMGHPAWGSVSLGIMLGLAVILAAILLTYAYVAQANAVLDELTQRIVEDVK